MRLLGVFCIAGILQVLAVAAVAGEIDLLPVDVPAEWRKLESDYRSQIDVLRDKRAERGEKARSVREKMDAIDFSKISEQAKQDMEDGLRDMGESLGDAAKTYFEGIGKRSDLSILDAGATIMTETLPAYAKVLDAQYAEIDAHFEMDRLVNELNGYEREIKEFEKKISDLDNNAALSKKIADLYEIEIRKTEQSTKQGIFRLKSITKVVKDKAQEKHDTVPPGWYECKCPNVHTDLGRIINGKRYHGGLTTCPQ